MKETQKNSELGVLVSGTEAKSDDDNVKEKKEKKIPNSFKADLEGFYMTSAWARKMMSKYGGKYNACKFHYGSIWILL
jgi:hypothetical protein